VSRLIDPIGDLLAQLLRVFFDLTGSYGLAIILLTLAIKLVLHPLTRTQLRSMKEMQYLAPQIQALREKYRDTPQQMNTEVMNLYRSHKVNPFGGCLPLLLQIPVLWGLFAVLRRENIFNGAAFVGFPLDLVPTFGAIAKDPLLSIWPILVGVTTYFQQRMSVTDPQQARLFIFMPVLVGWFAMAFPIGLSIYWIVSTLAYIAEYYIVVGRLTAPVAAAPIGPGKPPVAVLPQRPRGTKKR